MTPTIKSVLPFLAGATAGGLSYALTTGRSFGYAVAWGVGTALATMIVLWAATLSNTKPKREGPPSG